MFKYNRRDEKKVLFFFAALCISMTFHYFLIGQIYDILYFFKEFFMLVMLSYICYFFLSHMYKLIQSHTFISYLGLIIVILTIVYLSVLALYFTVDFFVVDKEVFECSNKIWMMIRAAELVLSILFLIIGFVISKMLKKIQIVYKSQVAKREKELWYEIFRVLIGVSLIATMTSFIESLVYIFGDYSQCFMMISGQLGFSIAIFCFLRLVTDYSVMSTVIYQFWKMEKSRGISIDTNSDEEILTFVDRDDTYNSLIGHDV